MSSKTKSKKSSTKGGFSLFQSTPSLNTIYNAKIKGIAGAGVQLYFIRHAHSCANMLESFGAKGIQKLTKEDVRPLYANNPHITNFGISHALGSTMSNQNYTQIIQPDVVCASQLIRTWETAYTLFFQYFNELDSRGECKNSLFVSPFIGENRDIRLPGQPYKDLDNQPEDVVTSCQKFNRFLEHFQNYVQSYYPSLLEGKEGICLPNIAYLNKRGKYHSNQMRQGNNLTKAQGEFTQEFLTNEPSFNDFIDVILPELIRWAYSKRMQQNADFKKGLSTNPGEVGPLKIVIVTHSKFMEENIVKRLSSSNKSEILQFRNAEGKVKVYNCDVYQMNLQGRGQNRMNLFFPIRENYQTFDNYGMPPVIGEKRFNIQYKNVAPLFLRAFFSNKSCLNRPNNNQCKVLFDILIGLCDKENPDYRQFLLNKLTPRETNKVVIKNKKIINNGINVTPRNAITRYNVGKNLSYSDIPNKIRQLKALIQRRENLKKELNNPNLRITYQTPQEEKMEIERRKKELNNELHGSSTVESIYNKIRNLGRELSREGAGLSGRYKKNLNELLELIGNQNNVNYHDSNY